MTTGNAWNGVGPLMAMLRKHVLDVVLGNHMVRVRLWTARPDLTQTLGSCPATPDKDCMIGFEPSSRRLNASNPRIGDVALAQEVRG